MAMTIHVFLMYPETRKKSLEEIEDMFLSNTPAWKTHGGNHLEEIATRIVIEKDGGQGAPPPLSSKPGAQELELA